MILYWIEFKYPIVLILLIFIPIIIYIEYRRKKNGIIFWPFELLKKIYKKNTIWHKLDIIAKILIYISFIIIIANPWINNYKTDISKKWIEIWIVLDISKSMLAEDMLPNRLEVSKNVIKNFISWLNNHLISFTIFAGKPFLSVPLTWEYDMLINYVMNITTENIKQEIPWLSWTAIWDWLIVATDSLNDEKNIKPRERIIVLITDWDANVWIDPKIAIKYVLNKKIKVYTIWIWNPEWTELYMTDNFWNKQYFMDANWIPIKAKLDEDMLKYLANVSWWKYYNSNSKESLDKIFEEISKIHKSEIITKKTKTFFPIYKYFIYLNIFLTMFLIYLKEKQRIWTI